jgi:osmotically-inducible protein OsmY
MGKIIKFNVNSSQNSKDKPENKSQTETQQKKVKFETTSEKNLKDQQDVNQNQTENLTEEIPSSLQEIYEGIENFIFQKIPAKEIVDLFFVVKSEGSEISLFGELAYTDEKEELHSAPFIAKGIQEDKFTVLWLEIFDKITKSQAIYQKIDKKIRENIEKKLTNKKIGDVKFIFKINENSEVYILGEITLYDEQGNISPAPFFAKGYIDENEEIHISELHIFDEFLVYKKVDPFYQKVYDGIEEHVLQTFAVKQVVDMDFKFKTNEKGEIGAIGKLAYHHKRREGLFVATFIAKGYIDKKKDKVVISELAFLEGEPDYYATLEKILKAKNIYPEIS